MFQSRRFDPVLQCSKSPWADVRRPRSLARASLIGCSLLALAACGEIEEPDDAPDVAVNFEREVLVTAAFRTRDEDASDIAFLPNLEAPSLGAVVAAPRSGGLDVYDADGEVRTEFAGPRLSTIATAPDFQLRGERLPLVFGSASDASTLHGFVVTPADYRVFELPLGSFQPQDGVAGLCMLEEGIGYIDLVLLGTGPSAEIIRIQDSGEDLLSVVQRASLALPSPARECTSINGAIYTLSPASGVTRMDETGTVLAELQIAATGISAGEFDGSQLIVLTNGASRELHTYHADGLERAAEVTVVDGLSTPGITEPAAIDITAITYGYTAYSEGMVGVFDRADNRVKVISREAFTRAYLTVE
ncbi:MAG: hypothetical protein VX501_09065 [Pseudomonadota bacterium]|nr:hypothetical protein [Pseudomonadota bacterium]